MHQKVSVPDSLDFHVANDEERRAAHANVHDVWSRGLPLEQHVARREGLPLNQRATWYVGTLAGRVVTSLGAHPLLYHVRGNHVPGIGIAAVHTLAEYRGRGYAPSLIAYVEAQQRAAGARLSMLFSDVDPRYYARQGYLGCPAHRGSMSPASVAGGPGGLCLEPFTAADHVPQTSELFASSVTDEPFYVVRTDEYARHLLARFPLDSFYWLTDCGTPRGFVRTYVADGKLMIRDFAVERHDDDLRAALFTALAEMGRELGLSQVIGWLPSDPVARRFFEVVPRPQEITMLKPLDPGVEIDTACRTSADRINEIDHV
jgi:GNAT superfamily N-acetyltransferase